MENEKLYKVSEVAKLLNIDKYSVYKLVLNKRINYYRMGLGTKRGTIRFSQTHVDEYLKSCEIV